MTALIAALVSLVVSLIAYFAQKHQMRSEWQRQDREMQRRFTEKLYDLRLNSYPKAFEITDKLRGALIKGENITEDYVRGVMDELLAWHKTKAGFILTEKSLKAFYQLRSALSTEPENGNVYSSRQKNEIWECKNRFRALLRADLNLLYTEEEDLGLEENRRLNQGVKRIDDPLHGLQSVHTDDGAKVPKQG